MSAVLVSATPRLPWSAPQCQTAVPLLRTCLLPSHLLMWASLRGCPCASATCGFKLSCWHTAPGSSAVRCWPCALQTRTLCLLTLLMENERDSVLRLLLCLWLCQRMTDASTTWCCRPGFKRCTTRQPLQWAHHTEAIGRPCTAGQADKASVNSVHTPLTGRLAGWVCAWLTWPLPYPGVGSCGWPPLGRLLWRCPCMLRLCTDGKSGLWGVVCSR